MNLPRQGGPTTTIPAGLRRVGGDLVDDALHEDDVRVDATGDAGHELSDEIVDGRGGHVDAKALGCTLVRLLVERLSIERDGCLVNVDNAPTNVPRRERHLVLQVQNPAFGRGGLPLAGAGPLGLPVDEEATGTVLLYHQTIGLALIDPVANRRGRALRPGRLVANHAQQHACKSQAKCTQREGPANAFHFLE